MTFLLALTCSVSLAQAASISGLELKSTFESIGVTAAVSGDTNANAKGNLEYRLSGDSTWRLGHWMPRIEGDKIAGSLLFLKPDTSYEVQVTLQDPDGVSGSPLVGSVRTRAESYPTGSGTNWYVNASSTCTSNCGRSPGTAFKSIQEAANVVGPGDVVHVMPGVYHEEVYIKDKAGNGSAYIQFKAEGPGVILDGASPAFRNKQVTWRPESGIAADVYSAPLSALRPPKTTDTKETHHMVADGQRLYLYSYKNFSDAENFNAFKNKTPCSSDGTMTDPALKPKGGFFADPSNVAGADTPRLYLYLADGTSPSNHNLEVAELNYGFYLSNCQYFIFEGFAVKNCGALRNTRGAGCRLLQSSNIRVAHNTFLHNSGVVGVWETTGSSDNLIEDNTITSTNLFEWGYALCKGTLQENPGISLQGDGSVARRNTIQTTFDAIAFRGSHSDANGNRMSEIADDTFEAEGPCTNIRIWDNRVDNSDKFLSVIPIEIGPLYFVRNIQTNVLGWTAYKVGALNGVPSDGPMFIYHNSLLCQSDSWPTWANRAHYSISPVNGNWANAVFRNNIFYSSNGGRTLSFAAGEQGSNNSFDHDILYSTTSFWVIWNGTRYSTIEELAAASGMERSGIKADPKYVDPVGGDLRLSEGSPGIDHGVRIPGINDDYQGEAPDIGAYESLAPSLDRTAPVISNLSAENINQTSAVIHWTTDEAATTQVEYGLTASYGSFSSMDQNLTTDHTVLLQGLEPATLIHYRALSKDAAGNLAASADGTCTTLPPPPQTLAILGAMVGNITDSGATVTWMTNLPADSQVLYGLTTAYESLTPRDLNPVTTHTMTLAGLRSGTEYHAQAISRDAIGNPAQSGDLTFTTASTSIVVYLEAESAALTSPMRVSSDASASGNAYIWVPNGAGSGGKAVLSFSVPKSGSYAIWGRVLAPSESDNSFHVSVDADRISSNKKSHDATIWDIPTTSSWNWVRVSLHTFSSSTQTRVFNLSAGRHTLYINRREDGTMVDEFAVTEDLGQPSL